MNDEFEKIIKNFGKLIRTDVNSKEVIKECENFYAYLNTIYPCSLDSLSHYIDLYRQKEFAKNIDTISCDGTAEYISNALENYCYK